jgi:hypothetical protein
MEIELDVHSSFELEPIVNGPQYYQKITTTASTPVVARPTTPTSLNTSNTSRTSTNTKASTPIRSYKKPSLEKDEVYELKLKRVLEVNQRLRDDLSRERIYASNACLA